METPGERASGRERERERERERQRQRERERETERGGGGEKCFCCLISKMESVSETLIHMLMHTHAHFQ